MMDYEAFVQTLKQPEAQPLTQKTQSFILEFQSLPKLVHSQRKRLASMISQLTTESLEVLIV